MTDHEFKKVPKDVEARIRKAAKEGRIEMVPSTEVDDYEEEWRALAPLLDQSPDECFISDLSSLRDFSGCGNWVNFFYPDWDSWITARINEEFQVLIDTPRILLLDLFKQMRDQSFVTESKPPVN